jgi:hypothetical protein
MRVVCLLLGSTNKLPSFHQQLKRLIVESLFVFVTFSMLGFLGDGDSCYSRFGEARLLLTFPGVNY